MTRTACPWTRRIALSACLAVAAVLVPPLRGQPFRATPMPVQDTTAGFCYILNYLHLTPLQSVRQLDDAPERTLLVVCGKVNVIDPHGLDAFLRRGGAALIATDQDSRRATQGLRITVQGDAVLAPPGAAYRQVRECPVITPEDFAQAPLPLFKGIRRIATNRPSYLECDLADVVTWFPEGCWPPSAGGRLAFAAVQERPAGRVLVLADHSVFIDEMMLQKDNDNFDFAFNCIQWLRNADQRRTGLRDRILFVYDGEIMSNFGTPLPPPPTPPIPPLDVNRILTGMEHKDLFNRLILEQVPLERILQVAFIALSVAVAAFAFFRLRHARHHADEAVPLPTSGLALAGAGDVVEQRHRALVAAGNVWESARALARQFFETVPGWQPPGPGAAPPVPSGNRSLARQLRRLWKLAYDPRPVRVTPRQLDALVGQLRALRSAVDGGTLRLGPAPPAEGSGRATASGNGRLMQTQQPPSPR
jgi:hypothetical protein